MESKSILVAPQQQTAPSGAWTLEPDEDRNQGAGWGSVENIPFFFLAQPPPAEIFDRLEVSTGTLRLIGTVQRTTTERLVFTTPQPQAQLKFYPSRIMSRYWNEGPAQAHTISGKQVQLATPGPAVLDVTYQYSALQFQATPPRTALAEDADFAISFILHGKKA